MSKVMAAVPNCPHCGHAAVPVSLVQKYRVSSFSAASSEEARASARRLDTMSRMISSASRWVRYTRSDLVERGVTARTRPCTTS